MGRVIVIAFGIMIMTIILVQSILLLLPFIKRIEFDAICNQYSSKLLTDGELDDSRKLQLSEELEEKGFANPYCDFPSAEDNSFYVMNVWSCYPMKIISLDLSMEEYILPLKFRVTSLTQIRTAR